MQLLFGNIYFFTRRGRAVRIFIAALQIFNCNFNIFISFLYRFLFFWVYFSFLFSKCLQTYFTRMQGALLLMLCALWVSTRMKKSSFISVHYVAHSAWTTSEIRGDNVKFQKTYFKNFINIYYIDDAGDPTWLVSTAQRWLFVHWMSLM